MPDRLKAVVHAEGIEIVHSHGYKADVYAYMALRRSPVPLVATCHNWIDGDLTLRLYGRLDRYVLKRFAGVSAVSADVRKRLIAAGVRSDKIHLIRNGVDLHQLVVIDRSEQSALDAPVRIGIVARLSPEKGVDTFLRMAALLASDLPNAHFLVAGEGPERARLEQMVADLGLTRRVVLLGRQEDMPAFYRRLDLLVLSSRTEGLPMAVLEGMASGLPVVATRVGEVPEVVQDGQTGYIVAVEDAEALAAAVRRIFAHPAARLSMGEAAREQVKAQFSAEHMAQGYLAFYRSVSRNETRQPVATGGTS